MTADTVSFVGGKTTGAAGDVKVMPGPSDHEGLPIQMLNDRILVSIDTEDGERRTTGGILIPATAQVGKRLSWAKVVAACICPSRSHPYLVGARMAC